MVETELLKVATAAWAVASALAVVTLGLLSFAASASRPPGTLAFGAFATLWGLHVIAGQWMAFVPEAFAPRAHLTYLALLIPLPYFLVEFAAACTEQGGSTTRWRAARLAAGGIALLTTLLLVVSPAALYKGTIVTGEGVYPSWGPLYAPLTLGAFFSALTLALCAFENQRRAAPTARTAKRHALVAAGLATFTTFSLANNFAYFLTDALLGGGDALTAPYLTLFTVLGAIVVACGLRAARDARAGPSARTRGPALLMALAVAVPLAWGLVEGLLAATWLPRINTVGLWRLAGVALLAYGLALWRFPDLPDRTRRGAATAAGAVAATALGGLSAGLLVLVFPGTPAPFLAAVAVPLASLSSSVRLAHRVLQVTETEATPQDALARRLDTYRAALEACIARGTSETADAPFLAGLRARLRISADVHEALVCLARANVLAPPDAAHPGYERLRLLGEGAQGRAWLARRRLDDELVVLKEPAARDAESSAALRREARAARALRSPHLLRIDDLIESAQGPILVTEYAAGGTLAERLRSGPMPAAEAVARTIEVLRGLEALHGAGLAHGDVKPANVLLGEDGQAKLADFGLMRRFGSDATLTRVGAEGTLSVMAPEQLDGAPPTPSSDVYAVGALLYRLLAGEHYVALAQVAEAEARSRIRSGEPLLPHARIPPAVELVLRTALAKEPAKRYPSAAAMRDALARATLHA